MISAAEVTRMDIIARLIEQLGADDEIVRVQAGEMLLQMGSAAVRPLIEALQNPHSPARPLIAATLGQIGDRRAVEPLIRALQDEDKQVRLHAALALGKLKDARAIKPLIRALFDEMPPIGPDPLTGDPLLVRAAAAQALGELRATEAVPALKVLLTDECRSVRRAAIQALGKIRSEEAFQALCDALWHEQDEMLVELILRTLSHHPSPRTQETLQRVSREHPKETVRQKAQHQLEEMAAASFSEPIASSALPQPKRSHWRLLGWAMGIAVAFLVVGIVRWGWRYQKVGTTVATVFFAGATLGFWYLHRRRQISQSLSYPPPLQPSTPSHRETN